MKKKILFISEASFMKTGFSKITHEILTRLYDTGKYELFEYGSYTQSSDPRALSLPWKFYGAIPEDGDTYGKKRYNSSKFGQFGEAMFEQVLLDCQPDICIDIRDYWMGVSFLNKSMYRDLFKLLTMPTIDGEPQRQIWIDGYSKTDALLTYSQYGKDVLTREASGIIDVKGIARPGVNHTIFQPMDKVAIRDKFGISQDSNIIMTVMRNQRRKLFPDLFESFSDYLKQLIDAGEIEKAANTYLYLHTSIADVGFDIGKNLLRTGISHKTLMTYVCRTEGCSNYWVDFFQTEVTHCSKCGKMSGTAPNTNFGVSDEKLAELYNIADLYVQYSICLAKDEPVLLDKGWTPIQDVKIGDTALTHTGEYKPVVDCVQSKYKNNMKEIKIRADYSSVKITDNHPVYALTKSDCCPNYKKSLRKWFGYNLSCGKDLPKPSFIPANELEPGDLIFKPIDYCVKDIDKIDLIEFTKETDTVDEDTIKIFYGRGVAYPRYLNIDEDFCKFMGLFAADGCWVRNQISLEITSHSKDEKNIQFAKKMFQKISNKKVAIRKYKGRNAVGVVCLSVLLHSFFKSHFGKFDYKKLPTFTEYLPIHKQKAILYGMFMGDGCEYVTENKTYTTYETISRKLADQLKNMLERCRIPYSCRINIPTFDPKVNRKQVYKFFISGQLKTVFNPVTKRNNTRNLYYKNYRVNSIKEINDIEYNDASVYNIEVCDNNSYVTRVGSVHNCEGLSMVIAEAKACGVPAMAVDYSAMAEQVNIEGCYPIKVEKFFHEPIVETEQQRALPDQADTIGIWHEFFSLSEEKRQLYSKNCRLDAAVNYSFERAAKIFEQTLDDMDISDTKKWDSPKELKEIPDIPKELANVSNSEFVDWCIDNIMHKPELKQSMMRNNLIKDLNIGTSLENHDHKRCDKNTIINDFVNKAEDFNMWETQRCRHILGETNKDIEWSII